jgi:hypothetical protein
LVAKLYCTPVVGWTTAVCVGAGCVRAGFNALQAVINIKTRLALITKTFFIFMFALLLSFIDLCSNGSRQLVGIWMRHKFFFA